MLKISPVRNEEISITFDLEKVPMRREGLPNVKNESMHLAALTKLRKVIKYK